MVYRGFLFLALFLFFSVSMVQGVDFQVPDLQLESEAALLMEPISGEIIIEKNIHERMPPASLTKIMTLLLLVEALEEGEISLEDRVIISSHAAGMGGSEIWLEQGEEFTVEELMKAVAISSANDASVALAEHLYGSERLFVQAMNQRVEKLGLNETHFGNASGLPLEEEECLITAHDIAFIARELLQYPKILEWTSIWLEYLRDGETELNNTNRLVVDFDGADGLKTGWTQEAGHCLVATAERKGVRLLAVVLKGASSSSRFNEAAELLSFGFGLFRPFSVVQKEEFIVGVEVRRGEENRVNLLACDHLVVPVPRGMEEDLEKEVRIYPGITAPIEEGEKLGEMLIYKEESLLGRVHLVAEKEVKKAGFFILFKQLLRGLLRPW